MASEESGRVSLSRVQLLVDQALVNVPILNDTNYTENLYIICYIIIYVICVPKCNILYIKFGGGY